jgi:hypothetical protein
MTAPIASGWSGCRVGLAPTGKRRLVTAHTHFGRCRLSKLGDKQGVWQFPFNVGHHEQYFSIPPGVCF